MLIGIKDLIKKGFSIWKTRLVPFLAIGVVGAGLGHVIGLSTMGKWLTGLKGAVESANPGVEVTAQNIRELIQNVPVEELSSFFLNPLLWLGLLLALLVSLWSQAALLLASYPYSSGTPETPTRSLTQIAAGASKFMWRLFLIEAIFGLAGLVLSLPVGLLGALNRSLAVAVVFGLVIAAVVVYLAVTFAFAPLLIVVENLGVRASLKRSRELVKKRWLDVAVRILVIVALILPLAIVLSFIPFGAPLGQVVLAPFALACAIALIESLKETQE